MELTKSQINNMSEEEKIMYVIKFMKAFSFNTAVTMEQIIAKGIELGLTTDYRTSNWEGFKKGDHPWWTRPAAMMGVGTATKVQWAEEIYLHRVKVDAIDKDGKKSKKMVYYYDTTKRHAVVTRKTKASKKKIVTTPAISENTHHYNLDEQKVRMAENPGKYISYNGVLLDKVWAEENPMKMQKLYGEPVKVYYNESEF